ncbi:IclR family transcriptional regulator [Nocardiopsis changdeensis]|uniref:IclR family transcriptional regulator n=1 Tax=Nocardiopsis changdeensis TaxID=2831969 RepID=A0ABX8BU84_9ACTN|nr:MULTISPECIES: IclR family transcriptional regulator [Nocardiopsis]QUX23933.1 IclR family transcriptional regulator [Nocardiopsis changdeensis]QYX39879.1 IclR family transcriptional regulator [Nocardiopsis sp. MT53]
MPGRIQSIERAAAILRLLAGGARGLSLAEISRSLELPKGTVLGILRTLQHVGFVEQDPESGRYRLGGGMLSLGTRYLDGNELRTRALNWADTLASRSGESVRIGTPHQGQVLVVHHVFRPDSSRQTLDVGTLLPLHATALGKVLMAFDPLVTPLEDTAVEEGPVFLPAYTRFTIVSPGELEKQLAEVRDNGWAWEAEELVDGEVSIAAPIRDRRGTTVGAIGVRGAVERLRGPDNKLDMEQVSYVRDAARAISRELGATPY